MPTAINPIPARTPARAVPTPKSPRVPVLRDDSYSTYADGSVLFLSRSGEDYALTLNPLADCHDCSCPAHKPCRHQRAVCTAPGPDDREGWRLACGLLCACALCGATQHRALWEAPGLRGYVTYFACDCRTGVVI